MSTHSYRLFDTSDRPLTKLFAQRKRLRVKTFAQTTDSSHTLFAKGNIIQTEINAEIREAKRARTTKRNLQAHFAQAVYIPKHKI